MQNFISWSFTEVILEKASASSIVDVFKGEEEVKIHTCIKNIVKYCNTRGDWDLFSWIRHGHHIDASDEK